MLFVLSISISKMKVLGWTLDKTTLHCLEIIQL